MATPRRAARRRATGDRAAGDGPIRTCIGCRARRSQDALVRLARQRDGTVVVGRVVPGRGAWLCADTASGCIRAVRRRDVARAFRSDVTVASLDALVLAFGQASGNVTDLYATARGGGAVRKG